MQYEYDTSYVVDVNDTFTEMIHLRLFATIYRYLRIQIKHDMSPLTSETERDRF